ncbi:hypothetical protein ACN42_g8909 [Penicillium freii]|uniref:Methyltransferase domain-containing protein n=1 Tax=Penicillium freii TaxID=48697 RepID=A0A117NLV4_PENFR|nr:hypothetical protein ACN42_g8909 [Penicillium freii]
MAIDMVTNTTTTESMDFQDSYSIVRGEQREIQRLDAQHQLYISAFGYHLHPNIKLPKSGARIADVGTGTAVFLKELATQASSTTEFHGFDISSSQFPPASSLPGNVQLHIGNAMEGFSAEMHDTFDVVTVRLLVAALNGEDWRRVTDHLVKLVKPGGWLQWQESDGLQGMKILRDEFGTKKSHLQTSLSQIFANQTIREKFEYPSRNLARVFHEAGLDEVDEDVVSTDREPHMRSTTLQISVEGLISGMKGGMNGKKYSQEEIDSQVKGWIDDMESGVYQRYNLHCFLGKKPLPG